MRRGPRRSPYSSRAWRAGALPAALLLAAAVPPARAEIQPQAEPVLERLLAATGGSEARHKERRLRMKGRLDAVGLSGRWEMWVAAPDRWARTIRLGPLRIREGFDGTVAWRTDLSGRTVTVLDAQAIEDAREEGWFHNEQWALADHGGAKIRRASRSFVDGVDYEVLEITPPGGHPRRLVVNGKTGFIDRVISQHDQYSHEEQPREYKKLGGRKRASLYESPTFLPTDKPVQRMTVDSVWVNPRFDSTLFSPPDVAERRIAWTRARGSIRVPFRYTSKAVLVKVSINGRTPVDFILDTGASLSVIDQDYAHQIGLAPEGDATVQGIAATGGMRFAKVGSISLAGRGASVTLPDFRVALVDLGKGDKYILWKDTHGLLGYDFLSRFVVTMDYDSLRVTLHDPKRFTYRGNGSAIPFELHSGIPVVEMTIDGCTGRFLVDTGNSFHSTVHGSMVRSCAMFSRRKRRTVEVIGGGIGGSFVSSLCRLDSLAIGPYQWVEPVAALALHTRGMIGSKDYSGNIGNDLLERFRCTFDYARHTLHLEPGRRYHERARVSRFGALLVRLEHRVYAGNILSRSAAYDAGLRWYDEILSIDGRPMLDWTREEVDRLLEEGDVGSVHTVTYRRLRDDPVKTVEVTLKDVL